MKFYSEREIKTLHLPITTGSISSPMGLGSDSSPVNIDLFGINTYLADSMQFMLEYGCRIFEKGSYYIMPSFRGEKADKRHLCQFYHSEAEIPGTIEDVIELVEDYITYLCKAIIEDYGNELKEYINNIDHIEKIASSQKKIKRITLDEAVEILDNNPKYVDSHEAGFKQITNEGEKKLISMFDGIVWLTDFDNISVPFYQASKQNGEKSKTADLLFGIGEVVGSGERHQTHTEILDALKDRGVEASQYEWYYQMKKEHPMLTSGFGMGVERFILGGWPELFIKSATYFCRH